MGETRVDLLHLLEDLRDAYLGPLEETILTEIVANSLDSSATQISIRVNPAEHTLCVIDNGSGMKRRDLARYHDVAASTKTRGEGIGFAGVGIKLGLLVCEEVVTETRRGTTHIATTWHLASRHRAPWKWTPPSGYIPERGTAVRLKIRNPLSPLLDSGFIEASLRSHFEPLLDSTFDDVLGEHYPKGVVFELDGQSLPKHLQAAGEVATIQIRLLRKRKPSAVGYLVRQEHPLSAEQQGLGISTLGKVIRRGWDWIGLSPAKPEQISGLIEVPGLAGCLTLNKGDFIRVGSRGATYLAYRKAVQEAVTQKLTEWGDQRDQMEEDRPRMLRPLERDLERIVEDLSEDFPLLPSLVEHRRGGQKQLPIGGGTLGESPAITTLSTSSEPSDRQPAEEQPSEPEAGLNEVPPPGIQSEPTALSPPVEPVLPDRPRAKRTGRFGLHIKFEARPDDPEPGRLVESTVWVNEAHPAYRRAITSRSLGYHLSVTVGLALAQLAVEPAKEHAFLTAFLSKWGETLNRPQPRRKKAHGRKR